MNQLTRTPLNLLFLSGLAIFQQLEIEEALLRTSRENWCIINQGSAQTSIVMGISAIPEEVVSLEQLSSSKTPPLLIKRFSGGGTVVVDENTLFFSLILNTSSLPETVRGPQELMKWTHELIEPAFHPLPLQLKENDFAIDNLKVGGNAQSFIKDRVLHHTSFLWNWNPEKMSWLSYPKRVPTYRHGRDHHSFCGNLFSYFDSMHELSERLRLAVSEKFSIRIHSCTSDAVHAALKIPHRKALEKIELPSRVL